MSLSEIMGSLQLWIFPVVSMVIFLVVFSCVCVSIFARRSKQSAGEAARIPLDDAPIVTNSGTLSPLAPSTYSGKEHA